MEPRTTSISSSTLAKQSEPFLSYLEGWINTLPVLPAGQVFDRPEQTALLSTDMVKGFCNFGPLASPRVGALIEPVVALMRTAWEHGVRHIILTQDTHEPDAVEFEAWPPHCVRGTAESEAVDAIRALPFYDQMVTVEKNSIDSGANTELGRWIARHSQVNTFVLMGDCTDLCIYQVAMHLRTDANARQLQRRLIVPANVVETYDRTVADAQAQGGFPHPGDFLHKVFLYHMALNGIEVVREIA